MPKTALFILVTDRHMAIGLLQSLLGWPSLNGAQVVSSSLWMETQTQLTLDLMQMASPDSAVGRWCVLMGARYPGSPAAKTHQRAYRHTF